MASPFTKAVLAVFLLISGSQAARFVARAVERSSDDEAKAKRFKSLTPAAVADQILTLPGFQNALPSSHFGGYITVDEKRGRRLYYYFVESERDPVNDPVVLWLNGGPGCSSFDGFVYEQGPFTFGLAHRPSSRGAEVQLSANPFAWNKVANMIFLDSPAGVGLSYSENAADYVVDDTRTAADADRFLRGWFQRYPQYAANDFYVSGESYAGIYVPNLVRQVLVGNEAGEEPYINIVGYLVGNGCTDERYDGNAHPPFAVGKSLLPAKGFQQLQLECEGGEYWNRTQGGSCDKLWTKLAENLAALNVYDTLQYCFHEAAEAAAIVAANRAGRGAARRAAAAAAGLSDAAAVLATLTGNDAADDVTGAAAVPTTGVSGQSGSPHVASGGGGGGGGSGSLSWDRVLEAGLVGVWPLPGGVAREGQVLNWAQANARLGRVGLTPPCTDSRAADLWLNDPRVRAAIHAAPLAAIGPWTLCSDKISYFRNHGSMIPIHVNNTKNHGLRALIYSGDHDMAVPHTGSEAWTAELGFPVLTPWQPWFVEDDQVAGFVVEYGHGLSYATVKGAGHMVPETNPRESLAMFKRFIDGKSLTSY